MKSGMAGHERGFKGETDIWLTPPEVLSALGPFDLDPCAAPDPKPWNTAKKMYTLPQNGLVLPWAGRVFLNPPYGPQTKTWMELMAKHGDGANGKAWGWSCPHFCPY